MPTIDTDDLALAVDIADLFEVTEMTVSLWRTRLAATYPQPVLVLGRKSKRPVRIWSRSEVIAWAIETGRWKDGHPVTRTY